MKLIIKFLLTAVGIYCLGKFAPEYTDLIKISFPGDLHSQEFYKSLLTFTVILALVNTFIGTVVRFITFPIRLLTLGLFNFVIIAAMAYLTTQIYDGIHLQGPLTYLAVGLIPVMINLILGK
ncbi:phage holin family protein [Candidatus Gracilibacteria bacterium]|nr:phage holin family protein [Candidatus Gracilibacteria bacterium]